MVDVKGALFERVAIPLLLAMLTPVAVVLGSKLVSGKWTAWLQRVPLPVWLAIGMVLVAWVVLAFLRGRAVRQRRSGMVGPLVALAYQRAEYGTIEHAGVKWRVMGPAPTKQLYPSDRTQLDVDLVEIETPPICPKCGTELEQAERYFGGYVWSCVRCGNKTKAKDSYYRESERAERLAKSIIRDKLQQSG